MNIGAELVIAEIETLIVLSAAVVGAAVFVVVVPWGARLAIRSFKEIESGDGESQADRCFRRSHNGNTRAQVNSDLRTPSYSHRGKLMNKSQQYRSIKRGF